LARSAGWHADDGVLPASANGEFAIFTGTANPALAGTSSGAVYWLVRDQDRREQA
jgi:hypothetical protein